ncbi:hypothetical protein JVT61DRAFT_14797 [Boletus reticuloceps]|uniref:Uncharacterized protein n=1 Tax=Boletus reticuloceps TaxID=495285 RepID=A0A8I2YTZ9_9AGAM|nr:hypothetical protein JVT61DRAFT_14797 [Boletus reticuloceps]
MPAQITSHPQDNGKTLGHVNLMVDTLIANATIEDLRAITRTLLATGTPSLAASFTAAARSRLRQTNAKRIATTNGLFATGLDGIHVVPTPELENVLARARSLYGAATVGLRWETEGSMANILAVIDTDICQAIQHRVLGSLTHGVSVSKSENSDTGFQRIWDVVMALN